MIPIWPRVFDEVRGVVDDLKLGKIVGKVAIFDGVFLVR